MSMAIQGYVGLDIPYRANLPRPVQIVRQFVSNPETQISAYHANIGLSIAPQNRRESRRITNIPGRITNPIAGYAGYAGNKGFGQIGLENFGLESLVFLFWKLAPCKSVIENQKYKIVKGAINENRYEPRA